MQCLKTDTIAYQFGVRPLVKPTSTAHVPVDKVLTAMKGYMQHSTVGYNGLLESLEAHPEVDAIQFYMMNHAMSLVRSRKGLYEPLEDYFPLVSTYHTVLANKATRMFYYLLLICTRESRHEKTGYSSPLWNGLTSKYGKGIVDFHKTIKGGGSYEAAEKFKNSGLTVPLGLYTQFLVEVFYSGAYSGGYGGKAWGAVADCLNAYVQGKYSAEMMLDTAFTLAHNNGPIFNKGMLFSSYTSDIYKILDVQRSGQIPQLVSEGAVAKASSGAVLPLYSSCYKILGEDFRGTGYVDWFVVEALGSEKKYPSEKQAQVAKHGASPIASKQMSDLVAKNAAKAKKEQEALLIKEAEKSAKGLEIMPGVFVTKFQLEREEVAA